MNPAGILFNARGLGRIFDEVLQEWPAQENGSLTSSWWPPCDVFEDRDSVKIVLEVPGVKPEDVKLTLENTTLTIRGEKKQEAEERTERVHRYERSYGVFERSFALPSTVDPERIQAHHGEGILTVTLPKAERARPREIPVKTA
jgi:HSP20 family protein